MSRDKSALVLALDEGTTNTKAALLDAVSGQVVAHASRPLRIGFPASGSVEQDAEELWTASLEAMRECLARAGDPAPAAIALSSQRESSVVWNRRTGRPLGPVLGWQDTRTAEACAALAADGADVDVTARTGLALDPMFSAPKMRWLVDFATGSGTRTGDLLLGTVDSWLVHKMTGEHLTEAGNASRTLLFDLAHLDWDPALVDRFGIPASALPPVRASNAGFGRTLPGSGLPAGVPVVAVLADSHAALYCHGCTHVGSGKATYGTGSSVMTPIGRLSSAPAGVSTTLAWLTDAPQYAREGNIAASGSALDWMAGLLGAPDGSSGGEFLSELAARTTSSDGVVFVPAFSGLAAPYWDRSARAVLAGFSTSSGRAQVARAALEGVAHQIADVVAAVESDGEARLDVLHADGGATASRVLMQIQADLIGRDLVVSDVPEASALGAALLAARTLGLSPEVRLTTTRFSPADGGQRARQRAAWADAVARARLKAP